MPKDLSVREMIVRVRNIIMRVRNDSFLTERKLA